MGVAPLILRHVNIRTLIILTITVLLAGCVKDDEPMESLIKVGDRLPDFTITLNDGSRLTTSDLRGRESVIVLFNTSCPDCREELPRIQQLHDEQPELAIICISRAEDAPSVASYWEEHGLTLPYSAQSTADVYHLFATAGIPRVYYADADLIVIRAYGPPD